MFAMYLKLSISKEGDTAPLSMTPGRLARKVFHQVSITGGEAGMGPSVTNRVKCATLPFHFIFRPVMRP